MLQDPTIATEDNLSFRSTYMENEEHVFDDFCSGTWWKEAEYRSGAYPNYDFELMPVSIYTDAANPDFRRKASLSPIVVQCLNFTGDILRRNDGKRVVGYFPKLKVICF